MQALCFIQAVPSGKSLVFGQEDPDLVEKEINEWDDSQGDNVWEHSGLDEGDIIRPVGRNGLRSKSARWPLGVIPYRVSSDHFTEKELKKIQMVIDEYNSKTCLELRPMIDSDENWIDIVNSYAGCWSSVGMQGGGQILNLQTPMCIRNGTIRHEMLHAIGFEHQQSSSNRDKFLKINWENINDNKKHNFIKYPESRVGNFGMEYDYSSIMHYSGMAFTKNGRPTMEPRKSGVTLIRKNDFSEGDLKKLGVMYKEECDKRMKT
uniref:Metalloendopeptidase n=1 Tax=Culicoides sonorensis TaxID=179676 RepID=A0A336MZ71_CULSO